MKSRLIFSCELSILPIALIQSVLLFFSDTSLFCVALIGGFGIYDCDFCGGDTWKNCKRVQIALSYKTLNNMGLM